MTGSYTRPPDGARDGCALSPKETAEVVRLIQETVERSPSRVFRPTRRTWTH